MNPGPGVTRLAPSPTGALHLGNARTFLLTWALARQRGWRIILRIEDLDGPRVKPESIEQTIDTLSWLGIDWDEGPVVQSRDLSPYREAMSRLAAKGLAYPCELTRAQIEQAASAPHAGEHETVFPASLRPPLAPRTFEDTQTNWRFAVGEHEVVFEDEFAGAQRRSPAQSIGDFVVWTKRGEPSYQLAVVVDDHRQSVTHVVRGDDLLDSAGRQILLYEALGLSPLPSYLHLPLVLGPDGRRLAKRHGDTRLTEYRRRGVAAEAIIGLVAWWSGVTPGRACMNAQALRERLRLSEVPPRAVTFTPEDEAWLLSCVRSS